MTNLVPFPTDEPVLDNKSALERRELMVDLLHLPRGLSKLPSGPLHMLMCAMPHRTIMILVTVSVDIALTTLAVGVHMFRARMPSDPLLSFSVILVTLEYAFDPPQNLFQPLLTRHPPTPPSDETVQTSLSLQLSLVQLNTRKLKSMNRRTQRSKINCDSELIRQKLDSAHTKAEMISQNLLPTCRKRRREESVLFKLSLKLKRIMRSIERQNRRIRHPKQLQPEMLRDRYMARESRIAVQLEPPQRVEDGVVVVYGIAWSSSESIVRARNLCASNGRRC